MKEFLCGFLSAAATVVFTLPLQAQTAETALELAFMPRTMTVTLLNDGGKYVAVDLKPLLKAKPVGWIRTLQSCGLDREWSPGRYAMLPPN
jgi:hypothetical protein